MLKVEHSSDYLKDEGRDSQAVELLKKKQQSKRSLQPKSRLRRQYNPDDINIAKLFLAIREHKTGNPQLDKINEIKVLLIQIRNINDIDFNDNGNTPLHVAVSKEHEDIVKLLLKKGAKVDIKNNIGSSPLDIAVRLDNQIIIGELQKYSELGSSNQQVSSVQQQPKNDDTLKELQTREPISIFQKITKEKDQSKKQNLEGLLNKLRSSYPDDLKIGVALKTGDCFFDSVAQGLNELKDKGLVENSERFNVKSLRKDCADYARENNKGETFRKYLKDIKNMAKGTDSPAIWERPEIEGQMISNKYDVVLYFYSTNEENGQKITVTKITPGSDDPEVFIEGENLDQLHIDSNEKVVRIVNYKKHFVPLLSRLEKDIEKAIEVSREEVYGVENKKSYSLIQDIGNFNPEENNDPNISEQAESQAQHPKIAEQQLDPLEGRAKRADNEPGPSSQIGQDSQSSGQQTRTRSKKPRSELIEMFLSEVTKEFDDSFEKLLKEVPSGHPAPSYDEFFIYFFLGSTITIPDRLIAKIGIKSVHFNLNFTDKGSKIIKLLFEINKDPQDRRLVLRTIIADGVKTLSGQYYSNDNIQEIVEKLNLAGDDANSYKVDARIFHITLSKDTGRVLRTSEDQKTKQDLEKALQKIQANVIEGVELQDKAKEFESIELQNKDDSSKFENALENLSKKINAVEEGVKELFKGFIEVCKKIKSIFQK